MSNTQKSNKTSKNSSLSATVTARSVVTLGTLKPDAMLGAALQGANATLKVVIDQDNANVGLYTNSDDRKFGSLQELTKILGFRKFITEISKETSAQEVMEPVRRHCWNTVCAVLKDEPGFKPAVMTQGTIAFLKDLEKQLDFLEENLDHVEFIQPSQNDYGDDLCGILKHWMLKLVAIIADLFVQTVKGKDTKGKLADLAFSKAIPKWAIDKLLKTSLNTQQVTDMETYFWPRDARKAIFFTPKELTTPAFAGDRWNLYLARYSGWQKAVLEDTETMKIVSKVDKEISFSSESDAVGTTLRGEKIFLTPTAYTAEKVYTLKSAKQSNLATGVVLSNPRQMLKAITEVGQAFQTGDFRSGDNVENYWSRLFPNVKFDEEITSKRNVFDVVKTEATAQSQYESLRCFSSSKKPIFQDLVSILLGVRQDSKLIKALVKVYDKVKVPPPYVRAVRAVAATATTSEIAGSPEIPGYERPLYPKGSFKSAFVIDKAPDGDAKKMHFASIIKAMRLDEKALAKPEKESKAPLLSELGKAGKEFLNTLRSVEGKEFLVSPVSHWLREFSSTRMQAVAVKILSANLDLSLFDGDGDSDDEGDPGTDDSDVGY